MKSLLCKLGIHLKWHEFNREYSDESRTINEHWIRCWCGEYQHCDIAQTEHGQTIEGDVITR